MTEPADGSLVRGTDGRDRCFWASGGGSLYEQYHDEEWGRPVDDDIRLFEKLCLEGFQAGLSWLTILRKRESFREAFAGFEPAIVSRFDRQDVERLLGNAGIVRHQGKINSTINNAGRVLELIDEFGSLAIFVRQYAPEAASSPADRGDVLPLTVESTRLSKELKRRGWSFVGPTTVYAFMQAMGLVNDHLVGCWVQRECGVLQAGERSMW